MFARSRAVSFLLFAVIALTLVSNAIAARRNSLPSINERYPLPDRLRRPPRLQLGQTTAPNNVRFTGPVDDDLYPPGTPGTHSVHPSYSFKQAVPAIGLVRGQQGKLVPIRLRTPLEVIPDPIEAIASSSRRGFPLAASNGKPGAPPSSNRQMQELLSGHPDLTSSFDPNAVPDPSKLGGKYHAVQLLGKGLDRQSLVKLQQAKKPFYVQGAHRKVWFFDTKDGKTYTFTDRMKSSDKKFIRNHFFPAGRDAIRASQAAASEGGEGTAVQAERLAGQASVRPASAITGVSWSQRLSEGARSFFGGMTHSA